MSNNPFGEMVNAVAKMVTSKGLLNVHEGMIMAYRRNNNVSRERAIAALRSQGLIPSEDKVTKE